MSSHLTKSERESIIFNHLKGKKTPGYNVIEHPNGKYTVKPIPIEMEEEDIDEDTEEQIEEEEVIDKKPHKVFKSRTKQNARKLLEQLTRIMDEDSEDNNDNDNDNNKNK